jgi:hypothetical protein
MILNFRTELTFNIVLILVFLYCDLAMGQTSDAPVELKAGESAPFTGVLYTRVAAMRITLKEQKCYDKFELDLIRVKNEAHENLLVEKHKAEIQADSDKLKIQFLEQQLSETDKWYNSPPFIAIVTVIATFASTISAVLIIDASNKISIIN